MTKGVSSEKVERQQRRMRAFLEMRISGMTPTEIAHQEGLHVRQVHYVLREAVALVDATKYLEVEVEIDLSRMEQLIGAYWSAALEGDIDSGKFILQVLDQKAKLLGLNAPKRVNVMLLIEEWAAKRGLDPADVIDSVATLLPQPTGSR